MKPEPRLVRFYEGWAAMSDRWMVCAFTREEAWRRFIAAEIHGKPQSQRAPTWVPWLCWWAAVLVAIDELIDGGGRVTLACSFRAACSASPPCSRGRMSFA